MVTEPEMRAAIRAYIREDMPQIRLAPDDVLPEASDLLKRCIRAALEAAERVRSNA